jgi:hypothetical protein
MTMVATTVGHDERADAAREAAGVRLRQRVRAEFLEMPGLKLTLVQAARIFGVDARQSAALLADLVDEGFLGRDARGAYLRRSLVAREATSPWAAGA